MWNTHQKRLAVVQLLSCVQLFATPQTAARQASLSFTNFRSLLKLTSVVSVTPSNHLILCRPLLLLPSIFSSIRVFSSESAFLTRWPKYWSFSFSISPFNEYSGLVSFRTDWLDLLAVQGTFKSLFQHHSLKSSVLCYKQGAGVKRWNWTDGPGHITFVGHGRKRGFDSSEVSLCLWWPTLSLWCT